MAAQQDSDPEPEPIVYLSATGLDWYGDPVNGLARWLIDKQNINGSWPSGYWVSGNLLNAWCVIMLNRTLFEPSPVAVASASPKEANPGDTVTFDHSGSYHLNPDKDLVTFRWDFDGDGVWDVETGDIDEKPTYAYDDAVGFGDVVEHKVTLQVEDADGKTDEDNESVVIKISLFNHPPVADPDPATPNNIPNYEVGKGGTVILDASDSYDPDADQDPYPGEPKDYITLHEWDLNNDGVFEAQGEVIAYTIPQDWEIDTTHTRTDGGLVVRAAGCSGGSLGLLLRRFPEKGCRILS